MNAPRHDPPTIHSHHTHRYLSAETQLQACTLWMGVAHLLDMRVVPESPSQNAL